MPDADLVRAFRAAGGGNKPVQAGMKVNWDADRDVAAEVANRPVGHLRAAIGDQRQASNCPANAPYRGQETSPTPCRWYRLARSPTIACGPDPDRHAAKVEAYADAGVDEAYVQQIGPRRGSRLRRLGERRAPRFHT